MSKRAAIDSVLGSAKIAVVGVSRKKGKFGSMVLQEMADKGMDVVGVNPHMDSILGRPCYKTVEDLPDDVEALINVVKPDQTLSVVQAAEKKGIRRIWMQQGSESEEAAALCREKGLELVEKECVFMYFEPVKSIHRFHRGINKIIGKYHRA